MAKKKPGKGLRRSEKHMHQPASASVFKKKTVSRSQWIIPFILIITFLAYIPALKAGFVNWDDPDYVIDNLLIKDFSNLKLLLTIPVQGNHHPLTMLTLAFNYLISGNDSWSYHLLNVLLHLVNCYLVFRLVLQLTNKNVIIAFVTSILFGIHPLHVESVAWVSERKDVLYALFFLVGLISYTKYIDSGSKKQYWLTLLFLTLSLLSKPAAVIFPAVLFCIDIFRKRNFNLKLFIEKIPFFTIAMLFGIITYLAQSGAGTTGAHLFGIGTRILMAFYGIMMYVIKMILPINQSAFYPFPATNESLPTIYYAGPIFFIIASLLALYLMRKTRMVIFGFLFYLVNLLLVLQFLPVGSAVIAERYTYIPYIGLFFIIGWLIEKFAKGKIAKASFIIIPLTLLLSYLTYRQASVWDNSASLWEQAIKNSPSANAFAQRAITLRKEGNHTLALEYFNNAIKLNSAYHEAFANKGNIYFDQNRMDLAIEEYKKALSIKPDYHVALDNMGGALAVLGQYDSSLNYLNRALQSKPDYKPAYRNRGYTNMKLNHYNDAINDFKKFLEFEEAADVYNTIGLCYRALEKNKESLDYINKAIETDPAPAFFYNRSYTYFALQDIQKAKEDALRAKQGGIVLDKTYEQQLGIQ